MGPRAAGAPLTASVLARRVRNPVDDRIFATKSYVEASASASATRQVPFYGTSRVVTGLGV